MKIFIILLCLILSLSDIRAQASFKIEFADSVSIRTINIKTTFTNNSGKTVSVAKKRNVDYIRQTILALGTYIVELQKYHDGSYKVFSPTPETHPIFSESEFISLKDGESISDTLKIRSSVFRNQHQGEYFSPGKYRIRVAFNTNGKRDKKSSFTKWMKFAIEQNNS